MSAYRFRIEGRVQGVGFRYFTTRLAESFDIGGWVRNTDDGAVEILATGDEQNIRSFREQIEIGPAGARVQRVDARAVDDEHHAGFVVRR